MCHTVSAKFSFFFPQTIPQCTQNTKCLKHPSFVGDVLIQMKKGRVLNLYARKAPRGSTRWRCVINLTPSSSYTLKRTHGTHCPGGYAGPRARLDVSANRKSFAPAGIRTPDGTERSQVAKHSRLHCKNTQITKTTFI
jgi:hypothetical protein